MRYQKPEFVAVSNIDLCNAVNNIDFLIKKLNIDIEIYNILMKFRSDLVLELKARGFVYG